ncbi:hypothetical protein BU23DRAFT_555233 [Bimuria novae-zelandiae CBS 107.79]|uniref:CCHC-type domain-containing protein n=1 Tax=Bimuria novae-zelandiae CBS 107.79 TaxID=1447943 RepID=A0A6A5V6B5_9PLEO|nr:hypothetical protein BU23DRAFT_555233 [Bimuria novae-zelandiae CBS 107.79]
MDDNDPEEDVQEQSPQNAQQSNDDGAYTQTLNHPTQSGQSGASSRRSTPPSARPSQRRSVSPALITDVETARRWFQGVKDEEELRQILLLKEKYDAGDCDAITSLSTISPALSTVHQVSAMRLPPQKHPHEYTRKDRRDFSLWKQDCERIFSQSYVHFTTESSKASFALSYVSQVMRTAWNTEVASRRSQDPLFEETWDGLQEKMLDALGTRLERRQQAHNALKRCSQRADQSPTQLLDYIRNYWEELEVTNEDMRVLDYMGCLNSNITSKINLLAPERRNTVALVEEQASIIYRSKQKAREHPTSGPSTKRAKDTKPNSKGDSETPKKAKWSGKAQSGAKRPYKPRNDTSVGSSSSSGVICYHCSKFGHISPNCPEKDKPAAPGSKEANGKPEWSGKGKGRMGS